MSLNHLTSLNFPNQYLNIRANNIQYDGEVYGPNQSAIIYTIPPGGPFTEIIDSLPAPNIIYILSNPTLIQGSDISFNPATAILTFNVAGLYLITYSIEWSASSTNGSLAKVWLEDTKSSLRYYACQIASSGPPISTTLNTNASGLIRATAGQTLIFYANQTSGFNQNIGANSGISAESPNSLCVYRLG